MSFKLMNFDLKTMVMNMNMNMNSGMSAGNSTTDDGSISMVFDNWSHFKMQLLFTTWEIQTPWQFALTWFAVFFAVITFHYLDVVSRCFSYGMKTFLSKTGDFSDMSEANNPRPNRPVGWSTVKILRGLIDACRYILGIFIMLIAMTLNPSLVLAIFVGYWTGSILCCEHIIDLQMHKIKPLYDNGGFVGTLIRWALCVPLTQVEYVKVAMYDKDTADDNNQNNFSVSDPLVGVIPCRRVQKEDDGVEPYTRWFLWFLPRATSLVYLVVLLVWIVQAEGSFGYAEASVFGWHPLLMSFFVVMFTNEALLTYKSPLLPQLSNNRAYLRYFHSFCHVFSLACIILGHIAIVDYKAWAPTTTHGQPIFPFYTSVSAHSWLGIMTVALFGIQVIYSVILYYLIKWPEGSKTKLKCVEVHHFLGHVMFALGLATCATGLQSMQWSDLAAQDMPYMINASFVANGHDDMMGDPYTPGSTLSNLASAGSVLLLALGIFTFAALRFLPTATSHIAVPSSTISTPQL